MANILIRIFERIRGTNRGTQAIHQTTNTRLNGVRITELSGAEVATEDLFLDRFIFDITDANQQQIHSMNQQLAPFRVRTGYSYTTFSYNQEDPEQAQRAQDFRNTVLNLQQFGANVVELGQFEPIRVRRESSGGLYQKSQRGLLTRLEALFTHQNIKKKVKFISLLRHI